MMKTKLPQAVALMLMSFWAAQGSAAQIAEMQDIKPRPSLDRAVELLTAAEKGAQSSRAQLEAAVAAVQSDLDIPEHDRFAVSSRLKGLAIAGDRSLDHASRMKAYEQAARAMIAAFPKQPEPYFSLMALAEDQSDLIQGSRLAMDLLALAAPPEVKSRAQDLLDRESMVGLPLEYDFKDRAGNSLLPAQFRGRVVVLYAWTGRGSDSAAWIGRLLKEGDNRVAYIGLNFDEDRENAGTLVDMYAKGSVQVFDSSGLAGAAARQLRLTRVPAIYLIDQNGILRDVRAIENFPAKLADLLAKGGRS